MEAEWIDSRRPASTRSCAAGATCCSADPEAALRETRRVLRPGGRLALAAWAAAEHNPWNAQIGAELWPRGLSEPAGPGEPGMFAFAPDGRIEELLLAAGFEDPVVEAVDFAFTAPSFDEWWEAQYDLSPSMHLALGSLDPDAIDELHEAVRARYASYEQADGSLRMPARALVASASG